MHTQITTTFPADDLRVRPSRNFVLRQIDAAGGRIAIAAIADALVETYGDALLTEADLMQFYDEGGDLQALQFVRGVGAVLSLVNDPSARLSIHGDDVVREESRTEAEADVNFEREHAAVLPAAMRGLGLTESPEKHAEEQPTRLKSAADRRGRPAPAWRVANFLPEWGVGQIYGASYTGKSFVALDLALRLSNGLPEWFGERILKPGPVVYALMEGGFDFGIRIDAWLQAHPGTSDEGLYTLEEEELNLASADSLKRFVEDVEAVGIAPSLVVIDTQALATPGVDENDNSKMGEVFSNLKKLARHFRCMVVVVHHTGYDKSRQRGASAQFAALDVQLRVDEGSIRLDKLKAGPKWKEPRGFVLEESGRSVYAKPAGLLGALAHVHAPGPLEETVAKILEAVRVRPGVNLRALREEVGGKTATFDEALADALENGLVMEKQGPNRARLFFLPVPV